MLIGVTGLAGSGKDTAVEESQLVKTKFASTLKDMLRVLYRASGFDTRNIHRKVEGDLKDEPCAVLGGATPRWAMKSIGTEWAKMVDPTHTIWSRLWSTQAAKLLRAGTPVVVTDVRFQHEADAVRELGGYLVRIHRELDREEDLHPSEQEMLKLEVDHVILNDGSIPDLRRKFNDFIEGISNGDK